MKGEKGQQRMNEKPELRIKKLRASNEELKERIAKLEREKSNLENLLEATEVGILLVDIDYRVQSFTPAATDIFDLTPRDQIGRAHV